MRKRFLGPRILPLLITIVWLLAAHVETDTRFRLGSITKQFTSMLVLQLVQEGKIKVEGKLTDYLPDYRKDTGDRITIHQLLNHTSGIPSYTSLPNFFQEISRKNRLCLLNRCQ